MNDDCAGRWTPEFRAWETAFWLDGLPSDDPRLLELDRLAVLAGERMRAAVLAEGLLVCACCGLRHR